MKKLVLFIFCLWFAGSAAANGIGRIIIKKQTAGSFGLVDKGKAASFLIAENDHLGVRRALLSFQNDVLMVTGAKPIILDKEYSRTAVIVGTIGHSKVIDQLVAQGKINVSGIVGKWESTLIQVVKNPIPGMDSALIVAGSDKRGTIYGIYELSSQIGVSPWYYWADVPVKKSENLYCISGRHVINSPAVKYRGIFLNDEAPALSGWAKKQFGGFNHLFYEQVFELILRLKGNYLWPAMWGSAFSDDDPRNPVLADEYGIVMGTSHHEPLTRAHDEWRRYKGGKWNYELNGQQLREFWESGLKRVSDKEQIITVGMRGDGDEPMSEGTATALLARIVKDQREIIARVTQKDASATPQIWALYKEVQDYYDRGMRVPDDVTLLLADDNWGNLRKLPKLGEAPRSGGYGIYYHFDYVGGPRNYKWINTNPIQKIWEQMHLAYQYQANQIWIVNVGDLKPMEFPITFFLDYAWSPEALPASQLKAYTTQWVANQFGEDLAPQIANLIDWSAKYNGRVKPELLNETTYSLTNYNEWETVVADLKGLLEQAKAIQVQLMPEQRDAYYQLVLHPIAANTNLHELYFALAKNKHYAAQHRISTNRYAREVDSLFNQDAAISHYYNKVMANGKWDHMMDQTHIGYTSWQQPEQNVKPATLRLDESATVKYPWGVQIQGNDKAFHPNQRRKDGFLITSRMNQSHHLDIFNTTNQQFAYQINAPKYLVFQHNSGKISDEERLTFYVDWSKLKQGTTNGEIVIIGAKGIKIYIPISIVLKTAIKEAAFVENNGVISMEAPHYSRAINDRPIRWQTIPNYGKTLGGVTSMPVTHPLVEWKTNGPRLEYDVYVDQAGTFTLHTYVSPSIDFAGLGGLKFAVSVDDEPPVTINISENDHTEAQWERSVATNIKIFKSTLKFGAPGKHRIKYWALSPGVVLQKMVLDLGGLKPSYLGPPETFTNK